MGADATSTERALALIAESSTLLAAGRPEEARGSLREAIEIAARTGAGSIEERARRELIAAQPVK